MKTVLPLLQTGLRRLYRSFRSIPPIRLLLDISTDFYTAETTLHHRKSA
jgi:hypothetical protein